MGGVKMETTVLEQQQKKTLLKKKKDTMTELQVYIDRQCVPKEQ